MKPLHPLRIKRLERGLSQYELAFMTGISQPKICYTEKGLSLLKKCQKRKIAKALKVRVVEIWPDNGGKKFRRTKGNTILTGGGR
jgi:transcriptional regulator with XRE-family HTH domain